MKKSKILSFVFAVVLMISLGVFAGCSSVNDGGGSLDDTTISTETFDTNEDVYSFGAFSTLSLLSSNQASTLSLSTTTEEETTEEETTEEETTTADTTNDEEYINEVNEYINMFEGLLASENSMFQSTYEESEMAEYDNKLTIAINKIDGTTTSFVLHFNEFVYDEEVEESEDEDELLDDIDESNGRRVQFRANESINSQEEVEIKMEGIMFIGDVQYKLRGEKEIEEDEVEFKFLAKIDNQNYVKVEQEKEEGEEEYKYTVVENGVIVSESSVEIKRENGEVKIELEISENGIENKYEFEKEFEDGQSYIKMEFSNNGEEREIQIRVREDSTGNKVYEYENENGQKQDREREDLDDDDDDDDEV